MAGGSAIGETRVICACLAGTYMRLEPDTLKVIVNDRPLIRLLMIIDEVDGYPTRKLLKRLGSNDLHPLLAKAEREGYVKREERKPEGRGNHMVCNYLTEKGKALVAIVKQVQS